MQLSRLAVAIKALRHLGVTQVVLNALYKFGLVSGHYRRSIQPPAAINGQQLKTLFILPTRQAVLETLSEDGLHSLLSQADEIAAGQIRPFGAEPQQLRFTPFTPLAHWTAWETGHATLRALTSDIKLIWEPARFGWAFCLGRAYHLSGNEDYASAFWRNFEDFSDANPPYMGPNWMSAQEVGLRLLAFVWAAQVFAGSTHSTPARLQALAQACAAHATRIPGTLPYARSQNNNHLLTEAAALITAALALPDHPQAAAWKCLGQKWVDWCLTQQIDATGEYVQHSSNYQRLMLQTALWLRALEANNLAGTPVLSIRAREKLTLATHWLLSLFDPESGGMPNLGANDGALILPLSTCEFDDYRPLAQAAARAFLGSRLPSGAWDELSVWLGLPRAADQPLIPAQPGNRVHAGHSWGALRAMRYTSRPSHADQLHFDLWWRGLNIAQDAGTYLYNAEPPWDNQLSSTLVHNTLSVDGLEQMTRAGRFLYLDWAPAELQPLEHGADFHMRLSGQTTAYARLGVRHQRVVTVFNDDRWLVRDDLQNSSTRAHIYRLHWLLPDWEWKLDQDEKNATLALKSPHGWLSLVISADQPFKRVGLLRAGERVWGDALLSPVFGWTSPTYTVKVPALSLAVEVQSAVDVHITSEFILPASPAQG